MASGGPVTGDGGWGGQQTQAGRQSAYDGRPQQHHPRTPQYGDRTPTSSSPGTTGGSTRTSDGSGEAQYEQRFAGHAQHQFHQGGWDATGTTARCRAPPTR
ncbi:hypothetical protein LT493_31135 [Streptomyces tricolor]|nr:hypothetical protein [Streptomyces tricolor]